MSTKGRVWGGSPVLDFYSIINPFFTPFCFFNVSMFFRLRELVRLQPHWVYVLFYIFYIPVSSHFDNFPVCDLTFCVSLGESSNLSFRHLRYFLIIFFISFHAGTGPIALVILRTALPRTDS